MLRRNCWIAFAAGGVLAVILAPAYAQQDGHSSPGDRSGAAAAAEPHTIRAPRSSEAAIHRALRKPIAVEFNKTPLAEVADYFEGFLKVNVVLDRRALEDVGFGVDTPITFRLSSVTARTALELMLRELDLTWMAADDVLLITTPEEEANRDETRLYDVRDVIVGGTLPIQRPGSPADFDALCELISTCIAPTTWEGSGPSPVVGLALPGIRAISVPQTPRIHQEVARLLRDLRRVQTRAKKDEAGKRKRVPAAVSSSPDDCIAEAREKLRRALHKRVPMQFVETPLSDVAAFIEKAAGVPVSIDRRALADIDLPATTPVTIDVSDVSLRSALELVLGRELDLTWTFYREVLLITTPEADKWMREVRVYDVADLAERYGPDGQPVLEYDSLEYAIKLSVDQRSWDTSGGPGTIAFYAGPDIRAMVVSQTVRAHQEIEAFLAKLRVMRDEELAQRDRESMSLTPPSAIWGVPGAGGGMGGGFGRGMGVGPGMGAFGPQPAPQATPPEPGESPQPPGVGQGMF